MKYFLMLPLLFVSIPLQAATMTLTSASREVPPAETFEVTVSLTADGKSLNVAEGQVLVPSGVVVDSVTTAGSPFTLWPTYPAYAASDHAVTFSGGAPNGVKAGRTVPLFTIRAHAAVPGAYAFSIAHAAAHVNDGTGAPEAVTSAPLSITVTKGAPPAQANAFEQTPLAADIGRDPSLFGGQYFVSFYGGDRGNGVRYEVKEGDAPFVHADRYYVLRDQTRSVPVTVRASDAAGTINEVTLDQHRSRMWLYIAIALAALVGAFFGRRARRRAPQSTNKP